MCWINNRKRSLAAQYSRNRLFIHCRGAFYLTTRWVLCLVVAKVCGQRQSVPSP